MKEEATAPARSNGQQITRPVRDPLWYKKGVIYELHVRAFQDSNADGIGDFPGLTQRLDYLRDLGVSALWLLPFYPSPLRDDGYDISDYYSINPIYGTLGDFKTFLREAHRRGLRVITELVVNHTSEQHPWFQRSRRAKPGSSWREFYVWSSTPDKYKEARIIFKDFELSNWTWDAVAQAYYWHRFYSHQPDLNYDHPPVQREIAKALDFWLDMGVDGVRLDAVPYLFEREGTSCENLPETHAYLKTLRRRLDEKYGDRMLLAEANQWPEDAVVYLGEGTGDECHMAFHFPLMPRLFMALRMEDRAPIVDILEQTPPIPETAQWALFLRNHDELTLEMVTDEERDYMYRVYANDQRARINLGIRRRLAPLLGNARKRIELLNLLLFSLPGTPVLYYGDEIGMGENIYLGDRNGVRTPMHWSSDKNAGFSRANPQALYLPIILDPEYHYEAVNVEAQQGNPHSLLWWMKRLLSLRRQWRALGQGRLEFLSPDNRKILAFLRIFEEETVLVTVNLSRFAQPVELDLARFAQRAPMELFGRTQFPEITERPYFLTLGPHEAFWFSLLERGPGDFSRNTARACERLAFGEEWTELIEDNAPLEPCLTTYLKDQRWFGGKGRELKGVSLREAIPIPLTAGRCFLAIAAVEYVEGDPEEYLLPLAFASGEDAVRLEQENPRALIARMESNRSEAKGVLFDAWASPEFGSALWEIIARRRVLRGWKGELEAAPAGVFRAARGPETAVPKPTPAKGDQSNTAVIFGDKFFLKLFRKLQPGVNPDLEIGRVLTAKAFPHCAPVAGAFEYRRNNGEALTLGILNVLIPGSEDAWGFTLDTLGRYYERTRVQAEKPSFERFDWAAFALSEAPIPETVNALVGIYLEIARVLGQRTGQLHLTLASESSKDFAPEPFTPFYQRSIYQSMRNLTAQNLQALRKRLPELPASAKAEAARVLALQPALVEVFRKIHQTKLRAARIRCHGDFHLGQVLYNGKDFFIIDFEGEPARSLGERRIKRSPLRDVAGMIRSFSYAAHSALLRHLGAAALDAGQWAEWQPWMRLWHQWVSAAYLRAYLEVMRPSGLLPGVAEELRVLLRALLLEKAVYEIGYELNNRPEWIAIPLLGALDLIEEEAGPK